MFRCSFCGWWWTDDALNKMRGCFLNRNFMLQSDLPETEAGWPPSTPPGVGAAAADWIMCPYFDVF